MIKFIKPSFIILLLFFSFVTCDSETQKQVVEALIGPEGGTVTSADGRLTLTFPPGALTEETTITITRVDPGDLLDLPPEFGDLEADLAYELTPDGLEFDVPVTASMILDEPPVQEDGSLEAAFGVVFTSTEEGMVELLDNLRVVVDGDANTTMVTGELSHFTPLKADLLFAVGRVNGVPDVAQPTFTIIVDSSLDSASKKDRIIRCDYSDQSKSPISPLETTVSVDLPEVPSLDGLFQKFFEYECTAPGQVGTYGGEICCLFELFQGQEDVGFGVMMDVFELFDECATFSKTVRCEGEPGVAPTPTPTPTANTCDFIIGDYDSDGTVTSNPNNDAAFVINPCQGQVIISENPDGSATLDGPSAIKPTGIPEPGTNPNECMVLFTGTGQAAGFFGVNGTADFFFSLDSNGVVTFNGPFDLVGGPQPTVGYQCDGVKPALCSCTNDFDCDDGLSCTIDKCIPSENPCTCENLPDDTLCPTEGDICMPSDPDSDFMGCV